MRRRVEIRQGMRKEAPVTLRNLCRRKVNQFVSIFSATDSVLNTDTQRIVGLNQADFLTPMQIFSIVPTRSCQEGLIERFQSLFRAYRPPQQQFGVVSVL